MRQLTWILQKVTGPWCFVQSVNLPLLWISGSWLHNCICVLSHRLHYTKVPRAFAAGFESLSLASRVWPHQVLSCLCLLSEQTEESGPAPLAALYIPCALTDKELTQIQQETSTSLLSSRCTSPSTGVSASDRPETPGLGNYGNFWMTSTRKWMISFSCHFFFWSWCRMQNL